MRLYECVFRWVLVGDGLGGEGMGCGMGPERIERFIDVQAFLRSVVWFGSTSALYPPSPHVSKLDRRQTGWRRKRDNLLTKEWGRVGAGVEPNHTAGRKLGPLEIIQSSLWPLWDTQGAVDTVACKKTKSRNFVLDFKYMYIVHKGTTNLTFFRKWRIQTLRHIYKIGFLIFWAVFCAFGFKVWKKY